MDVPNDLDIIPSATVVSTELIIASETIAVALLIADGNNSAVHGARHV